MTNKDNKVGCEVEYNTLRAEILQNHKNCLQILAFAITGTGVILGIAVNKIVPENEGNWLFMLPQVILVPCLYLYLNQVEATFRLGSYIRVFLEPGVSQLNYEERWSHFRKNEDLKWKNYGKRKKFSQFIYNNASLIIFNLLSVGCILFGSFTLKDSGVFIFISIATLFLLGYSFVLNYKSIYGEEQATKWEAIKAIEEELDFEPLILSKS